MAPQATAPEALTMAGIIIREATASNAIEAPKPMTLCKLANLCTELPSPPEKWAGATHPVVP
ncbi:hypothetical protein GCM10009638_26580 [Luteococcus sanguinis]